MVLRAATPSKCVTGSSINRQRAGPRVSGTVGVPTAVSRVPRNAPGRRAEFIHKLTSAGCDAGCVAGCVAGQAQRFHKSILPCFSVKPVVFLLCHLWDFAETTSDGRNPSPRTPASGPASSARWPKVTAHARAGARRARLRPRRRARAVNRCAKLSSASREDGHFQMRGLWLCSTVPELMIAFPNKSQTGARRVCGPGSSPRA